MSTVPQPRRSVLFVDESNTRLSFMAEQVARFRWGDHVHVASAGWDVREPAPSERAVAALTACGLDVDAHRPRRLRDVDPAAFELVVVMSRPAVDKLPRPVRARAVVWTIEDPWQGSDEAYADVLARLADAVDGLFADRASIPAACGPAECESAQSGPAQRGPTGARSVFAA